MLLVVGLGNPGKEYINTRHNAGFLILDKLVSELRYPLFKQEKKFNAEISIGATDMSKIIVAKPQTFMNESGKAVRALMDFYKITTKNLIVVHDDKDILLGDIKVQTNRSAAGHRGVESIVEQLSSQDFTRVRVGVAWADKEKMGDTADFVLKKFAKDEQSILDRIINRAVDEIKKLII